MVLIGYERISTTDQELDLQHDALRAAGCARVFVARCSGATGDRFGLAEALAFLRAGDTLDVWKLDRLGRSMRDLVRTVEDLDKREVGLRSLTEQLGTKTPGDRLIFHIFGALAQFERDRILERSAAGLISAHTHLRVGTGASSSMDVIAADRVAIMALRRRSICGKLAPPEIPMGGASSVGGGSSADRSDGAGQHGTRTRRCSCMRAPASWMLSYHCTNSLEPECQETT